MQLVPTTKSARLMEFRVLASGWNGDASEIVEVGKLTVNAHRRTATFSTAGPWRTLEIANEFSDRSLEVLDSDGLWTRWLLELGTKALSGSRHLGRFV